MVWVRNRNTVTDWGEILMGAKLPRDIQPSDIDGILEVRGRFLVMERKKPGEDTREGQEILLKALSRLPRFTVIKILHGSDGIEEVYNYRTRDSRKTNPAEFISWVEDWAWRAEYSKR